MFDKNENRNCMEVPEGVTYEVSLTGPAVYLVQYRANASLIRESKCGLVGISLDEGDGAPYRVEMIMSGCRERKTLIEDSCVIIVNEEKRTIRLVNPLSITTLFEDIELNVVQL